MDNGIDPKPNYLELDEERSKLLEKILLGSSTNARLDAYLNYFLKILSFKRTNIEEAFLSEFLEHYLNVVKRYEVWGNDPELTRKIFEQLLKIKDRLFTEDYAVDISTEIARLESQWTDLTNILNGIESNTSDGRKAYFPVIDNEAPFNCYGLIESVTVRINKADGEDKFIIIPSEKEIEQRIANQIKISWRLALGISKKYVRKHNQYHEVIISFDKKAGFYVGNSLGIALTLTFLEQILKFYNPTYIIKISEGSAFTGGIDSEGNVLNTGEEIIKRKVAAIFYSELNSLVIPKLEESYAYFTLEQFKKVYPHRKLKLIVAEDIDDILNRRDLVEVKKQKAIVRTGKFVKKNWISAVVTVLLAILFAYLFVMDFDDNPAFITADGKYLYIQNINGKKLWKKPFEINKNSHLNEQILSKYCKIIDLNNDGNNEVLISNEIFDDREKFISNLSLRSYDKNQKLLWTYSFNEHVKSSREKFDLEYNIYIGDTLTVNNEKSLAIFANNGNSYSSAVFTISLNSRNINSGIMWCAGHTYDALIRDLDGDKKNDLLCIGLDNGFEDVIIFGFSPLLTNSIRPSTDEYSIEGLPFADFIRLIRIPKTDYDFALENRFQSIDIGGLEYLNNTDEFYFILDSDRKDNLAGIWYKMNKNLLDFNIIVDNQFRIKRDTLVKKGILDLPYSDTKEFEKILKNQILYWDGSCWVKREIILNK